MSYAFSFSKEATKELDRIDRTTEQRIRDRLAEIALDPYSNRLSQGLVTGPGQRYSRVGDWRIIFQVIKDRKIIEVSTIQHRSRVYKELKK